MGFYDTGDLRNVFEDSSALQKHTAIKIIVQVIHTINTRILETDETNF